MKPVAKTRETVKRRPAETSTGIAGAVIVIVLWAFGIERVPVEVATALAVVVGALPAVVTWFRER